MPSKPAKETNHDYAKPTEPESTKKIAKTQQLIDNFRAEIDPLTQENIAEICKDPKQQRKLDAVFKNFSVLLKHKQQDPDFYLDDDRVNFITEFNKLFARAVDKPELIQKRKELQEDEEREAKKLKKGPKAHGEHSQNTKDIPGEWFRVPPVESEMAIMVNKIAVTKDNLKKQLQVLAVTNPMKLGKILAFNSAEKGIILKLPDQETKNNVIKTLKQLDPQLEIKDLELKKPKMKIVNISWPEKLEPEKSKENKEKAKQILERNIIEANGLSECDQIKILDIFSVGKMNKLGILFETSPRGRSEIQQRGGKLFVGNGMCHVTDKFDIAICYRCKRYNHTAKTCPSVPRCSFCSGAHMEKACTQRKEGAEMYCLGCDKRGHGFATPKCQIYIENLKRDMKKINYPYDLVMVQPENSWSK